VTASAGSRAADVVSALSEQGHTVASAESLTGGSLCSALVAVPGASAVVRGGVIAYATELKNELLGVDADLLSANGPVDPGVATQMALGVRARLSADWGLATTGVAGPQPQGGFAPGRVYVAVAGPREAAPDLVSELGLWVDIQSVGQPGGVYSAVLELDLPGDRTAIRNSSVDRVLGLLLVALGYSTST
jgi:nicotinamide-nucleotide amidase